MKIERIEFKNFKCYPKLIIPENPEESLPEGLFLIQGITPEKSNSFGKTSLVEGIIFGLFGPGSLNYKVNDLITFKENKCEIKIIFKLDGKEYMIHRILTRNTKSGKHDFKIYIKVDGNWKPDKTIKIENLLEIEKTQAKETVFVEQGQIESLAISSSASLRNLIIKLFRLDIIEEAIDALSAMERKINSRMNEITRNLESPEQIQNNIDKKTAKIENNSKEKDDINGEITDLENELSKLPDFTFLKKLAALKETRKEIESKLEAYKNELKNKCKDLNIDAEIGESEFLKEIEKKTNQIEQLEEKLNKIKNELRKINDEISRKKAIIGTIERNKRKMTGEITFTEGQEKTKCPTCTREISYEEAKKIIDSFDKEIKKIKNEIEKLIPKKKKLEDDEISQTSELRKLRGNIKDLETIQGYIKKREELEKNLEVNNNVLKNLLKNFDVTSEQDLLSKFDAESIEELRDRINILNKDIKSKKELIQRIESEIKELKKEIDELKIRKEEMVKLIEERDDLQKRKNHISKNKELIKGFITEYMVEKRLIHNIQYATERFLRHFTGGQYQNLSLQSVKIRGGSGIKISVYDDFSKQYKDVDFLSGGDKVALGFALRIGISDLMRKIRPTKDAPKKNPKISFMILDEPLAALDKSRRMQVLTTLESQKDFNQIFLITHTAIPDDINPNLIQISKNFENGLSTAIFKEKNTNI
ncbi:MAG: AAA family ATPase [Promethearchaeota archaeon]